MGLQYLSFLVCFLCSVIYLLHLDSSSDLKDLKRKETTFKNPHFFYNLLYSKQRPCINKMENDLVWNIFTSLVNCPWCGIILEDEVNWLRCYFRNVKCVIIDPWIEHNWLVVFVWACSCYSYWYPCSMEDSAIAISWKWWLENCCSINESAYWRG